ncbi:MAG: S9 family peptidase, partial [Betaproteobacteria bacterium]|nr:S9 family peptidase [Betaproteobacteria bacterium]
MDRVRRDPGADDLTISPDGKRIVFAHDPLRGQHPAPRMALAQITLKGRVPVAITDLVRDADWDLTGPSFSPDGLKLAFLASHQALKHTMPQRLAVLRPDDADAHWETISDEWDREVHAPLIWSQDASSVLFRAEDRGRQP